jgi:Zn-dependent protease with chaperone function
MYTLALIAETPVILARFLLAAVIAIAVLIIENKSSGGLDWVWVALAPTLWSMLALITPIGSAWWRWFVLDNPRPDAAVCGNALMLSRGLLETDHVPAVLAHELGHLGSPDARLTAALNRLVILSSPFGTSTEDDGEQDRSRRHQRQRPRRETPRASADELEESLRHLIYGFVRFLFITSLIAKGGFGLWLTGPVWGRYWRRREYKADEYAASLGQADELADFLEVHALIHDHPVPFIWLTEHTHPPTELRIDKLRNTPEHPAQAAGGTSPATPENRPLTA